MRGHIRGEVVLPARADRPALDALTHIEKLDRVLNRTLKPHEPGRKKKADEK